MCFTYSFGEGSGYIFLAETSCSGSERTLGDCDVEVHHSDMCDHSSDVGIVCGECECGGVGGCGCVCV